MCFQFFSFVYLTLGYEKYLLVIKVELLAKKEVHPAGGTPIHFTTAHKDSDIATVIPLLPTKVSEITIYLLFSYFVTFCIVFFINLM